MAVYRLCKALHYLYTRREVAMAAREGDFSALEQFELTPQERAALVHRDLVALWRLGAHPILLFHFAAVFFPRETYVREVVPRIQGVANPFYDYYRRPRKEPGHAVE